MTSKPLLRGTLITISVTGIVGAGVLLWWLLSNANADKAEQSPCEKLDLSQYKGVNFIDKVLTDRERGGPTLRVSPPSVLSRFQTIKADGFNVVRVPMYWESYTKDREAFMQSLQTVANSADQVGLCVILDNQQWKTSSFFSVNGTGGGFPGILVGNRNSTLAGTQSFWKDYYDDTIVINKTNIWTWQSYYLLDIVLRVDSHPSILGYEILNEPAIYDRSQYYKAGDVQTFIASKLREYTSKTIFFSKVEPQSSPSSTYIDLQLDPQTKPRVKNIVFDVHHYTYDTPVLLPDLIRLSSSMGVPMIVGEWGAVSENQTMAYLQQFRENKLGWLVWVWDPVDPAYQLNNSSYDPLIRKEWLLNEMPSIYGN